MARARPSRERGFVLIGAIWLLVLAGAIGAVLMLRARTATLGAEAERTALADSLLREAAMETLIAELVINGKRSAWALVPRSEAISIDGVAVQASLAADTAKLDVNDAELGVIDAALQTELSAVDRAIVLTRLARYRQAGRRLSSDAELAALFAGTAHRCGWERLSVHSGRTDLIVDPVEGGSQSAGIGVVLAIEARAPDEGMSAEQIRLGAARDGMTRSRARTICTVNKPGVVF